MGGRSSKARPIERLAPEIFFIEIDGRLDADALEIGADPRIGGFAAELAKVRQEIPIGVQSVWPRKTPDQILGFDQVDIHALVPLDIAGCNEPGQIGPKDEALRAIEGFRRALREVSAQGANE